MKLLQRLKRGVKAGLMAMQEEINNEMRIINLIDEFEKSRTRKLMTIGEKYYKVQNDILNREMYRTIKGKRVKEANKANNKLAHGKYHAMVDEKVNYFLSKQFTLKGEDDGYTQKVSDILGKHFSGKLKDLGYEASNKGKGWLHPYITEKGVLKFEVIPAEQIIPEWQDAGHTRLLSVIRKYSTYKWVYNTKKEIVHIEYWTGNSVSYYIQSGGTLIPNDEKANIKGHYLKNGSWMAWGKVPFICFKNNWIETPDISFVKSLIDSYDKSRSDAANYIEEVKNIVYILKGYGGEDITEFVRGINEDRAIPIDDPENGGVDTLTPSMDITAIKEHYEQLKRDICEDGQSVDKDIDKYGANPSGVALGFMYAGLDLKCNAMEAEFKNAFEYLLNFVNIYLSESGGGNYSDTDIEIIFNRAMRINETEIINNAIASKETISNYTIISRHPWVEDTEEELKRIDEEENTFDKVPLGGEDVGE